MINRAWQWWLMVGLSMAVAWLGLPMTAGAASDTATASRLVSATWLQQNLGRPDLVVLDASMASLHRKGHIPGAINADLYSVGPREVTIARMEQRLQGWGLSPGQQIVIHDEGGSWMATRLFWDLLHNGVPADKLFILDGGMDRWRAAGGAVTVAPTPKPAPGSIRITARVDDIRIRLPEFLAAGADPRRNVLLDALEPDHYYGGAAFFNRAGHVPRATLMPSSDFFNADKTFKSPQELQRMFDHLGISRDQAVHTHCGGGGAATVPFFALKFMLAHPKVTLFLESQMAWLQDERDLPFWTYAAPDLLRDTPWVKSWASPMMRGIGASAVSLVDVRSADDFKLGHLPQSLNVPAATFRSHLGDRPALARLLGQAGLDPRHEAVVVSEGGLNPASALAFWQLERSGQRKVSLYLGHVDRWAELGHEVVRPTAAGAAVVPAQNRPLAPDRAAAAAPFPAVFVASGERLPQQAQRLAPEGRVVHLPHARLLKADGTPRPAHEIWAALDKAGVPRYAEVVLVADDPGDAAVNYVILRLMGFADVKVRTL